MARYGRDFDQRPRRTRGFGGSSGYAQEFGYGIGPEDFRGGGRFGPGGEPGGGFGGSRAEQIGGGWRDFPGEEGWHGTGSQGAFGGNYQGFGGWGSSGGGYDRGFDDAGRDRGTQGGWGGGRQVGQQSDADRIRAVEIMTTDPEAVTPETSVTEVARKMRDLDVGIIPVVESEGSRRLQGVVTDRDLAVRVLADGKDGEAKVADFMTRHIETVNKNDSVRDVLNLMKREQVRRVPVTDRDGRLVGIIAQADLAVDYAGLDLQRETEVEEVIERISEPARPRRGNQDRRGW